jgi:hypothetical protein
VRRFGHIGREVSHARRIRRWARPHQRVWQQHCSHMNDDHMESTIAMVETLHSRNVVVPAKTKTLTTLEITTTKKFVQKAEIYPGRLFGHVYQDYPRP